MKTETNQNPGELNGSQVQGQGPDSKLKELKKKAKAGDAEAQFLLGERFERTHDYNEAEHWYKSAVAQGHAKSMNALAVMYIQKDPDNYDKKEVRKLIEKAASMNCPAACFCLGTLLIEEQDIKKGLDYYIKSADLGDGIAARELGKISLKGDCNQPIDIPKAIDWFEKAYDLGECESIMYLVDIYAGLYSIKYLDRNLWAKWLNIELSLTGTGKFPLFHEMPILPPEFKPASNDILNNNNENRNKSKSW